MLGWDERACNSRGRNGKWIRYFGHNCWREETAWTTYVDFMAIKWCDSVNSMGCVNSHQLLGFVKHRKFLDNMKGLKVLKSTLLYWVMSWLVCWFVAWFLVGLLVCWLVGWLFGWLFFGWFVGLLVCWFVCLLVGWLVCWLFDWLVGWLVVWLVCWLVVWFVGWLVV